MIVYVVPYVPIPRIVKRINSIDSLEHISAIYWDRGQDSYDLLENNKKVKRFKYKSNIKKNNSLSRLISSFSFGVYVYKSLRTLKPKIIHASKTDVMAIVWLYKLLNNKVKVIYEVSDLHHLAYNKKKQLHLVIIRKFLYGMEKIFLKKVDSLVVTSPYFWDEYYKELITKDKVIYIPNSPEKQSFESYSKIENNDFTIGFIGKVRYKKELMNLIDIIEELKVRLFIAGNGPDLAEVQNYAKGNNNIRFFGEYNYEKDISDLYGEIDCIYSMYDVTIENVKIALPNRLYEAAFCGIPLIVSENTKLAEIVKSYQLGEAVETGNKEDLKIKIEKIKKNIFESKRYYERYSKIFIAENSYEKLSASYKKFVRINIK